jgi:hypothetical protein
MDWETGRLYTIREVSQLIGVPEHRTKYALSQYRVPERQRAGIIRLWADADLPTIRSAVARTAARRSDTL